MNSNRIPNYFRAGAANERGFPRAERTILPRDRRPLMTGSDEDVAASWEAAEKFRADPTVLEVTLEKKGSKWPDFIGHQLYSKGLLASERVCDTLSREGITGFKAIPVEFVPAPTGKLANTDAPRYFAIEQLVEIPFRCSVFHYANGVFRPWGNYLSSEKPTNTPKEEEGYCLIRQAEGLGSSEGILFGKILGGFGCDRRVVELALREKWTNLQFTAFDAAYFPRMSTPSAPEVSCSGGSIDTVWYSPLQEEVFAHRLPAISP